jgi:hypothetical protein
MKPRERIGVLLTLCDAVLRVELPVNVVEIR